MYLQYLISCIRKVKINVLLKQNILYNLQILIDCFIHVYADYSKHTYKNVSYICAFLGF